jgi:hypothetical protein
MLLLLLVGAGTPVPPAEPPYIGDTYIYDETGGSGPIADGAAQAAETIYD